jgi:nitrogen fixation NifU-like protein
MYSAEVLSHFENPRGVGELEGATVTVEVTNPVCGDLLQLSLIVNDGQIAEARFRAKGCVPAIACGSKLVELVTSQTLNEAGSLTPETIAGALGGLPQASLHAAALAVDALKAALKKLG